MVVLEGTMYKELLYRENMMKPATRDATQLPSNFRGQRKEMSFSGLLWSRNDHRRTERENSRALSGPVSRAFTLVSSLYLLCDEGIILNLTDEEIDSLGGDAVHPRSHS